MAIPFFSQLSITTPTGTPPLSITSSDLVTNLNSDLLDGQHGSYFEGRDTTAIGFSAGTITLTRAAGNLTVSLDGRYLPLTGGTLTGALNGTSAAFSGSIISGTSSFSSPALQIGGFMTGFYVASGSLFYKSGNTGIHNWRNTSDSANTMSLDNSGNLTAIGVVTGTSFSGAGTGLTGTAASLNIGGNAATATSAALLGTNTGANPSSLQYWQLTGNSTLNPNTSYWYALRMGHGDADTYYSATIAVDFFNDDIQFRRKTNGTNQSWRSLLHAGNFSSYALPLTGGAMTGSSTISGDNHMTFGPNSTWSNSIRIGGNGYTATGTQMASVATTNGNLHLDSAKLAARGIYLNWYGGDAGTYFGNGSSGQVGLVDGSGNASFSGTLSIGGNASFVGQITGAYGPTASFYGNSCDAASYNYVLGAANDGGNKLVIFVNGSTRSADGGVNSVTIRNDAGPLNLGFSSYATNIFGSSVSINGSVAIHAGNYTSYAAGLGTYNVLTNVNQFRSNIGNGFYLGTANNPPLQAFSSDGGAAFMSFHRSGFYAVNMGLDPDNVLRIGGWSAAANRWQLDMSGNETLAGSLTAVGGIFSGPITQGPYSRRQIDFTSPAANFGNFKQFLRLWAASGSGSNLFTLRVSVRSTWNWATAYGGIEAVYSLYMPGDGSISSIRDFRITHVSGPATDTMRLGDAVIENGFVSIPVWCANTNPICATVEQWNGAAILGTTTAAVSEALPAFIAPSFRGGLTSNGPTTITDSNSGVLLSAANDARFYIHSGTAGAWLDIRSETNGYAAVNLYGGGATTGRWSAGMTGGNSNYRITSGVQGGGTVLLEINSSTNVSNFPNALQQGGNPVLSEAVVTFTPTTVGWYRIAIAGGISSGTIRINGLYDNRSAAMEFDYTVNGWNQNCSINVRNINNYAGTLITQIRASNDVSTANGYLDIYIATATTPGPLTIYNFGPSRAGLVASPVVGAVVGTNVVRIATVNNGMGLVTTGVVNGDTLGIAGNGTVGGTLAVTGAITQGGNQVLHAGNVSTYALPISGGTLTGAVSFLGTVYNNVGGARFFAGNSGVHYLYTNTNGMVWRNQADTATLATLTDAGAFNAVGAITQNGNQVLHAGNYPGYFNNFVQGQGSRGRSTSRQNGTASNLTDPSGFYYGTNVTGMPTTDWWNWLNCIGNDWSSPDGYGYQLAYSFWSDDIRMRRLTSGTWNSWIQMLHSGNSSNYPSQRWATGRTISLTGDVTGTSGAFDGTADLSFVATIPNSTVTNAKLNTMGATTIKGNNGAVANSPSDLTPAQVATMLSGQTMNIAGNAATASAVAWSGITSKPTTISGFGITDIVSSNVGSPVAADTTTKNGFYYVNTNISLFGQTDGALFVQAYDGSWASQIYQDYRTGQLAIRGRNSGTWQAWRTVLDSANFTGSMPNSGVTAGTYNNVTVNAKGIVTAGSNAPYMFTTGGTMTGSLVIQGGTNSLIAQESGTASQWYGRVGSANGTSDRYVFLGTYGSFGAIRCQVNSTGADADLYINTVDGSTGGTVRLPSSVLINGSQALHAGTTSAPNLSIGGNAASASSVPWSGITSKPTTFSGYGISDLVYGSSGSRNVWTITNWNQTTYPNAHFLSSESNTTNAPSNDFIYGLQTSFHRSGSAYRTQIVTELYSNPIALWARNSGDSDAFTAWVKLLHSSNYTDYAPTKIGGGASGNWGINITGSAAQLNGQAASYYENRDTTAVGFSGGTLTLTRAAGNLTVSLDGRYITGNQTISLSGDVTGSGATAITTTIAANAVTTTKINNSAVTYAKIQNVGAASVLGNPSASVSQAPQEITFGNLNNFLSGAAKAWVTFNENPTTGAITINASFNVSSITRINYGQYRVNFSTAFGDANYAISGTIGFESNGGYLYGGFLNVARSATPKTTTYCEVTASYGDGNTYNARYVHVVIDR
jgi:hypothetical protein